MGKIRYTMRNDRSNYLKALAVPCVGYSMLAGALTAVLVYVFKLAAQKIIALSALAYAYVREKPVFLPILVCAALLIGLLAVLVLKWAPDCKGGGIPTVVSALRGLIPFKWIKCALVLPISALLSFLCGVPLGNEGPCVQMGAALGEGTVRIFGKNSQAWRRYIMTGAACAGFAVATGAPVAGILFAVEEAHRRLSPMIFMTASVSVVTAQSLMLLLCSLSGVNSSMFDFNIMYELPLKYLWAVIPVGIICGICAIFFARVYRACGTLVGEVLEKVPFTIKVCTIFVAVSVAGFFSADLISSGHSLADSLVEHGGVWYVLILAFLVRALLLMLANNVGITGGLFIPTLTFGAILGSLCATLMTSLDILPVEYYSVIVIVGMASFLGASSRIPLTACVFALEALCGASGIFPVTVGVTVSLLIIEIVGVPVFSDAVIESKIERRRKGKTAIIVDVFLTVKAGAFVCDKEIRDILWPPTCTVLSLDRTATVQHGVGLAVGDVLHVHYQTFEPHETFEELEMLVGRQDEDVRMKVHKGSEAHTVPENT